MPTMTPPAALRLPSCSLTLDSVGGAPAPPEAALAAEWLLTDGLGAFAMGTAAGVNTRRYHSLFIAAANPPVARVSTLNALLDSITVSGRRFELSNHEFHSPGGGTVFHPHGFDHLERFEKDLSARWVYRTGPLRVTRELSLVEGRQRAVMTWRVEPAIAGSGTGSAAAGEATLSITPLVAMRDFHHLRRSWGSEAPIVTREGDAVKVEVAGWPALWLLAPGGKFTEQGAWWYSFARRVEAARHQDDVEDLYAIGAFEHTFTGIGREVCAFSLEFGTEPPASPFAAHPTAARAASLVKQAEHLRKTAGAESPAHAPDLAALLAAAADDFVVGRTVDGEPMATALAGYPWFADWGRDTMISLSGLLLATGRFEDAKSTLLAYARNIRRGLVPNHFDDYGGEPHYNTVDASLWFIHAALEYRRLSGDQLTWRDTLAGACEQIIEAYQLGTDGPIRMAEDGLIEAGSDTTQLTWMDAKRDGIVFTPRHGKAVEVNALWYRALMGCSEESCCDVRRAMGHSYARLAAKVKRSFLATFWSDELGHCIDHVNEHGVDRSLRPNQVLAVSLPHSPLSSTQQRKVMQGVREKLLTPMGLRTLPVDDANYHGRYTGTMFERDRAYHQGTVWGWLIGPYVEGWLRAHRFSAAARDHARESIGPLIERLRGAGMGQLNEIYDGDEPHCPQGCPAQAWSVAELLRAAVIVGGKGPRERGPQGLRARVKRM